jgi:CheY-like chemotaxis protein
MNRSLNILILDDDSICNFIHTRIAETSGFFKEVRSLYNGKDGLEMFDQVCKGTAAAPDIILLDLNMPIMDGFNFIQALHRLSFPNKERLSIIVLTSSDSMADKERVGSLGIQHYLLKPLTLKDLQTVIFSLYNNDQQISQPVTLMSCE